MIVNPGSVGCPAYMDTRGHQPFVQQTGAPDARYAVVEKRDAAWSANLHSVPYETASMAKLAKLRGAESWVRAVTTGWMA